ncbi:hypothetical protein C7S20_10715 [Christiangramia fulva]|uniref:Alpha/beta hydrolase n=1 Tax=Christiangramia fulva TaxID=2126553 RepID=A0A2R3Z602_9FLAO|nr:hypothetical protein [Christiangramia fulva]AVR45689.1 hypothetical protein C7S20_10715 [Christiangramia fulva]
MKKYISTLFIILIFGNLTAQDMRLRKGAVTDSLPLPGTANSNFALYLPTNYDATRKWPLLMVFDPQGRGQNTVNLFRTAAEEQGYILASPNLKLKDKPIDSILTTATSLMYNIFNSLAIDKDQVFSAGMAEGAQVASTIPLFYKNLAGVMAVGNSFVNPKYLDREHPYTFIGIAGRKDYMLYEMEAYMRFYDNIDFPTYIYYFDGKADEWPPTPVITNAVSGFTLQAIKNGKRPALPQFIDELYQNEMGIVEKLRRTREFYKAYGELDRMKKKYGEFGYEDEIKDKMKEIKRSKGFREQRRDFRKAVSAEKYQQDEYEYLLHSDVISNNFENIGWWAYQVDELKKLEKSPEEATSNMAYRLHDYLDFVTKQQFDRIMESDLSIETRIFISVLRTAIKKSDPEAYLKIIQLAGGDGDYETALLYLEDLLKTGYNNYEALYDIPGILDLQLSREYNNLIRKYLGKAKYSIPEPVEEID